MTRYERWRIRIPGAAAVLLITLGLSGAVKAYTGAGTPCSSCLSRCYSWSISHFKTDDGCKDPNGSVDWACMSSNCRIVDGEGAGWCAGCIPEGPAAVTDCEHPNCWLDDINIHGGTVCSNGCYGAICQRYIWLTQPEKSCGQVQKACKAGESTVACSKCGCQ